jgi:hypothetical protein
VIHNRPLLKYNQKKIKIIEKHRTIIRRRRSKSKIKIKIKI